jgi:uncharacterized protein
MSTAETRRTIVERIAGRIAAVVSEHPKRMLLVGLLIFGVLAPGVGRVYQNIKYYIWFPPGDPTIAVLDKFEQRFGSDLASLLFIHSPSGIFDKESAELVVQMTDRMWQVTDTMRVESLSNFPWIHAEGDDIVVESLIPDDRELTDELLAQRREVALKHEQLPGFLVSKDGKTAVIYGWLRPTSTGEGPNEYNDIVTITEDLKKLVKEFEGRGDHEFHIAGFPVVESYVEVYPPREMERLTPAIIGMCVVLLLFFFRRLAGMLLPFVVVFPSVIATLGIAGWSDIQINPMTITSPNIMVIIGISCTVHVLFGYFRALDRGLSRKESARHALERELVPTFFSCLTIGIGFLSLLTMTVPPLQQLGVLVAGGTAVVWLLTCLFLGPLLVLLPIRPKRRKSAAPIADDDKLDEPGERARRLTGWIDRYKVGIVGGWAALLALSLWWASHNEVSFDPIEWYDPSTDVRTSLDFLRDRLGSSESYEIIIDSGKQEGIKDPAFLTRVDQFAAWLRSKEKVVQVFSLVDILKETNRALYGGDPKQYRLPDSQRGVADQYLLYTLNLPLGKNLNDRVTLANDALRLTAFTRFEKSPAVMEMAGEMHKKAAELGLHIQLTGRNLLYHQLNNRLVPSFFNSMISGTFVIAIVLLIYFRSLRLALFGLFLELIPLAIGAGIVFHLLGKNFDMSTISTFSIVLGVTVDDTVHFLHGYGRWRQQGLEPREAITRVWPTVGAGMLISQMILAGCFALFVSLVFPVTRIMGEVIAMLLVIAFIANVTLSPALLLLRRGTGRPDRPDHIA